jgi:hypothetical protein
MSVHSLDDLRHAVEQYEKLVGGKQLGPRRFYNYVLERARTGDLQGGNFFRRLFKKKNTRTPKPVEAVSNKPLPARPPPPRPPPPPAPYSPSSLPRPEIGIYDPEQHGRKTEWAKSTLADLESSYTKYKNIRDSLAAQLAQANDKIDRLGGNLASLAQSQERHRVIVEQKEEELREAKRAAETDAKARAGTNQQYSDLTTATKRLKQELDRHDQIVETWKVALYDFSMTHKNLLDPTLPSKPAEYLPPIDDHPGATPLDRYTAYLESHFPDPKTWPPKDEWPRLAERYAAWVASAQSGRRPPPFGYGGPGYVNPNQPKPTRPPPPSSSRREPAGSLPPIDNSSSIDSSLSTDDAHQHPVLPLIV